MNGKLICIEGLDGSGKATQTELLCGSLVRNGVSLRRVSFPDYEEPSSVLVKMYLGGGFGTDPNQVNAYAASSFYAVDRYASYQRHWRGDYEQGKLIVADRYTTSNMVFQLSKLPKSEWDGFIAWLEDFEYGKLSIPKPDLTIYLEMPTAVSQRLLSNRYHGDASKKDIHESNTDYLTQCRESAAYAAQRLNWKIIHCAKGENPRTVEEIQSDIMKKIAEELPLYVSI